MTTPKPTSHEHPDSIEDAHHVYEDGNLTFSLDHLENERCGRAASGVHSYVVVGWRFACVCCGADGGEV